MESAGLYIDDQMERTALERLLEAEGLRILRGPAAHHGAGADLLIADLNSSMRGLKESAALSPEAEIIVLGDRSGDAALDGISTAGPVRFLQKPIPSAVMINEVMQALHRRAHRRRKNIIMEQGGDLSRDLTGIKDGIFTRASQDPEAPDLIEVGVDLSHFQDGSHILCVEFNESATVEAGSPFARLHVGEGSARPLLSPVSGTIMERNGSANHAMCVLMRECLEEDWALWLLRIKAS